jgi:hypothetical protein
VGVLGLRAGIYLFKLNELGRKFAIALLSLRIAYNAFFIVRAFFQRDFSFAITYFDTPFFVSKSVYAFVFSLIIWVLIAFGTILFLIQRETKMIFVSETVSEENSKPIAKTMPDQ